MHAIDTDTDSIVYVCVCIYSKGIISADAMTTSRNQFSWISWRLRIDFCPAMLNLDQFLFSSSFQATWQQLLKRNHDISCHPA